MKRTIVIGDIHGCFDELVELVDQLALTGSDQLISVGDLVDRGPKSPEVVRWFRERPETIVLMGNHERKHVRDVLTYGQRITKLQLGDSYEDARAWMTKLPYYYESDDIRVVHAAMIPGVPLAHQREDVLCGSTSGEHELAKHVSEGFWHEHYTDDKPIVFGHHVTGPEPLVRADRVYGIDTGACHGMCLTAISFPDRRIYSVPAREDYWTRMKREWQVPVLRAFPWIETSFRDIAEKLDDLDLSKTDVADYANTMREWLAELQAAIPTLHGALASRVAEIDPANFTAAANATNVAPFLFQLRAGRLAIEDLRKRLFSPALVVDLASRLGVGIRAEAPA